jgi:hypothetical protein
MRMHPCGGIAYSLRGVFAHASILLHGALQSIAERRVYLERIRA